jgi:hypothetical protein
LKAKGPRNCGPFALELGEVEQLLYRRQATST